MTRKEVCLLMFLAWYVAGVVTDWWLAKVVFGLWMLWWGLRWVMPRFDRWCGGGA